MLCRQVHPNPSSLSFISTDILCPVHQFGLFEFRTGKNSAPSTPTMRSRAAIFGLDAISRNLFNARPGSSMGDFFGGSMNGHRRAKSTTSRSSMYTQTTTTGDGSLMKFSHRSNSSATTAATSTMDDESFFGSKSSKSKKLLKRSKSPGGYVSEPDRPSPARGISAPVSRSQSPSKGRGEQDYSDVEDDDTVMGKPADLDSSEWDLAMKLELARQNSKNQHGKQVAPMAIDTPGEATIYEGMWLVYKISTRSVYTRERGSIATLFSKQP